MSREAALRRHLRGLEVLDEAVRAMKSLSAHHFRRARAALTTARAYRASLEEAASEVLLPESSAVDGPPTLLVVGANLGLCAHYHAEVVEAAARYRREGEPSFVDCIGTRTAALLARAGLRANRVYDAPGSVEGATHVLLEIVDDLLVPRASGHANTVDVVSARFGGVGAFEVERARLLPLRSLGGAGPRPSPYVTPEHLAEVTARERTFIALYELLLDAMASEHGARLVATNAAGDWLGRELETTRRHLRTLQRDAATREILELSATSRRR